MEKILHIIHICTFVERRKWGRKGRRNDERSLFANCSANLPNSILIWVSNVCSFFFLCFPVLILLIHMSSNYRKEWVPTLMPKVPLALPRCLQTRNLRRHKRHKRYKRHSWWLGWHVFAVWTLWHNSVWLKVAFINTISRNTNTFLTQLFL